MTTTKLTGSQLGFIHARKMMADYRMQADAFAWSMACGAGVASWCAKANPAVRDIADHAEASYRRGFEAGVRSYLDDAEAGKLPIIGRNDGRMPVRR